MRAASATDLRCLVACPGCERQFDAAGLAAGSRFHCSCGGVIEVPRFRPHDAEVVRCSSCSAPRSKGSPACEHCGADYTLRERDLHTICPSCMSRVSDRARYCHNCAKPIVPQGTAGAATRRACPVCGPKHKMISRAFERSGVSILECPRCAGIWLSHEGFDRVRDRARESATVEPSRAAPEHPAAAGTKGALYRRCPECRRFMNRRNYGRRSGVVVDTCKEHGMWFDARELEDVLRWVRAGGEVRAAERARDEKRARERSQRIALDPAARAAGAGAFESQTDPAARDVFRGLLGVLFDL